MSIDGESPSLRLAGRLATVCSQIGPLPRPKFSKAISSNGTTVLWARSLCTPLTALTVRSTKQSGTYGRNS